MSVYARAAMLAGLILILAACATASRKSTSLYDDLGGREGIAAITDAMLKHFAADPIVKPAFAHTDIFRFRRLFIEKICVTVDGPCEYTGDTMQESHRDLDLDAAQFNSVVEDLIDAMNDCSINVRTQNRLIALLAPMRKDIIHK